jgi:DNA-binding transcriptional LysR family regulator
LDRFQELQTFVAVADHGGFAAAARATGRSPPAVTRMIADLERRLGTPVFTRTTRTVRLTDGGARFLADARRILADLRDAENVAAGAAARPTGTLRVTAPVLFGQKFVAPVLAELVAAHSALTVETVFVDRVVNLVEEGFDLAIRIGPLPDSGLIARRVGSVRRVVCAAPAFLERHGAPDRPEDISHFPTIAVTDTDAAPGWAFQVDGKPLIVHPKARLRVNTNQTALDLVRAGHGLSRLMSYQIAESLADETLVSVLERFAPPALPIHLVHAEGRAASAKIRTAMDTLAARIGAMDLGV